MQRQGGLRRQVDENVAITGNGRFHQTVGAFEIIEQDRLAVIAVEAQQRAMGLVAVESPEWQAVVNVVLGHQAGQDRFADPAFFTANEMNLAHAV